MLEFNHEHKVVDLSTIKSKIKKVSKIGTVTMCGIMISAVLLLSGCDRDPDYAPYNPTQDMPGQSITAIVMENDNALIVDLKSYIKWIDDAGDSTYNSEAIDKTWVLYTVTGDRLYVDVESVKIIEGEASHEKAETIAQALISENGQIICYDEVNNYGKTR